MANLLITNDCPRSCTFCFAKSRLGRQTEGTPAQFMSRDNLRRVMDFLEGSGEMSLRLLGGEPTRHPEFHAIVEEALERGFHVHVFTNAMMPQATADFLASTPMDRVSFLCNVSPQSDDAEDDRKKVDYALAQLGSRAQAGITLTAPTFDYAFLLPLIERYGLKRRIRIGIAQPIVGENNAFLAPADYREAGKNIVAMAEDCIRHNILIGFDCGMTLCMFSQEELGKLLQYSEGFRSVCEPIIDIGPELDIWHCFPLSEVLNSELGRFRNRNEAVRFYRQKVQRYRTFGCMDACLSCAYLKRGQCSGGCLAHAMNSLNKLPPREAR